MKKSLLTLIIIMGSIIFSACGNDEKSLIGTWEVVEGAEEGEKVVLSENGMINEEIGIFNDSYGISWQISDGKIQFIYYGEIEEQATYKINGKKLTLNFEDNNDTVVLEKQ